MLSVTWFIVPIISSGASHEAEQILERVAAILRQSKYQTSLPSDLDLPGRDFFLHITQLGFLLRPLILIVTIVATCLIMFWLVRHYRLRTGHKDAVLPTALSEEDALAKIPSGTADQLASEGRYSEAIHALLLETLSTLSRIAKLSPSLTSREIVARVKMAPAARKALAGLVSVVEITHFGGALPNETDYRACVARFHAFLETYRSIA